MTKEQIDEYRKNCENSLLEKVSELDTNIFYLIIGSLGFFLTINEKFIGLKESNQKWAAVLSIALLLTCFYIYLNIKHLTTKIYRIIINYIDDELKADDDITQKKLNSIWKDSDNKITNNKKALYWLLAFAITFEIYFFMFNIMKAKETSENDKINKIEIINIDKLQNK